jgi:hypothetical protein
MADHDQGRTAIRYLCEEQIEEGRLAIAVKRRGRLVGDDEFRRANQRTRGSDPLLLADAKAGSRGPPRHVGLEPEAPQSSGPGGRSMASGSSILTRAPVPSTTALTRAMLNWSSAKAH